MAIELLILRKLEGGDRRSIGRSEEVVSDVLENPGLFKDLVTGSAVADVIVRMRASDAIEKIFDASGILMAFQALSDGVINNI